MTVDQRLIDDTYALLGAAVAQDHEATSALLVGIAERHDVQGVYGVCCALAQMVTTFGLGAKRGRGTTGVQVTDRDGTAVNPDEMPPDERCAVWAARFVAAYANNDGATTLALFQVSMGDPDGHIAGIAHLIRMTSGVLRAASIGCEDTRG